MANQTVTVFESDGVTTTDVEVLGFGRQAAAASKSLALATEDKAVFDAIAASLALLDNAIASGNELQVDVVGALPAGDNNIGNVDVVTLPALAAGTNNIGDVDVLTLPALPAGTNNIGDVDIASIAAGDNNIGNVDIVTMPALPAGTNNIGDVDVLTVPADPFGVNADAASATGSISAKLRAIATALGATALDLGSGTGGSRTLRQFIDTAQWTGGAGAVSSAVQRVTHASDDPVTTALQIIDDWDESDRAKVNPIAGQAGVAAGAGAVSALTQRMTLASDDPAVAGLGGTADAAATAGSTGSINAKLRLATTQLGTLTKPLAGHYETVAAGQTDQMLGATGAAGDYLAGVLIIPATTSPGAVSIEDGSTNIPVFTGGATSVSNLVPFFVPLGIYSVSGGWEITTGTNVAVIGVGSFT